MKSPCFDDVTRTDCPDRHAGCAVDCEKWKAYVDERDKFYKKRIIENDAQSVIAQQTIKCAIIARKDRIRNRRRHRRQRN